MSVFRKTYTLTCFAGLMCMNAWAGISTIEGVYKHKNIYIGNALDRTSMKFCISEVRVNGQAISTNLNSSSFQIPLTELDLEEFGHVVIQLKHGDWCTPEIINPDAIEPEAAFELISMQVDENGVITWTTKGEAGALPFIIEQYKWHRWMVIGEVMGKGTPKLNSYRFQATLNSGENQFRIKQPDLGSSPRLTETVKLVSSHAGVSFEYSKRSRTMVFDTSTGYEVIDRYGNIVETGYGTKVDLSEFKKDVYYVNYDNHSTTIPEK